MTTAVPILLYHSIAEDVSKRFQKWVVPPEIFARHMEYLDDYGYTPITVTRLAQAVASGSGSLPNRPVVLTFDDGFADFYANALPAMTRHGFTGTLYIPTGFVGKTSRWLDSEGEGHRSLLSWEQISEINASGVECGAHSCWHPQLDTLSLAAAAEEITISKQVLEQRLGLRVSSFAYPYGYHSPAVRKLVLQAGFSSACGVKNAMSSLNDDPYSLARVIVTPDATMERFGGVLTGSGLRVAPINEQKRTKVWRMVRRYTMRARRRPGSASAEW